MWLPIFIFFLGLMVDTAQIFTAQAMALRVVQDANRSLSIGRLMTVEDTEAFIRQRLGTISPNLVVSTVVVSGLITSTATMPATDLSSIGILDVFASVNVNVTAEHMSEN